MNEIGPHIAYGTVVTAPLYLEQSESVLSRRLIYSNRALKFHYKRRSGYHSFESLADNMFLN